MITDIREYIKLAQRTSATKDSEPLLKLRHATDGFTTETGELVDVLKRHDYYCKPVDEVNVKEELGDMLWYFAEACAAFDFDPCEIMTLNIAKLRARFPDKFTTEQALHRDLAAERTVLENGNACSESKKE